MPECIFIIDLLCGRCILSVEGYAHFTPNTETIASGAGYLSIVAWSYVFQAVSQCYILFQRAINKVSLTVSVTVIAIFINIVLNYVFINGKLGMPAMGVKGAALGTLVARCFECVVIVFVIYMNKGPGAARLTELVAFNKNFVARYFRTVTPVVLNEFLWGLGVTYMLWPMDGWAIRLWPQ